MGIKVYHIDRKQGSTLNNCTLGYFGVYSSPLRTGPSKLGSRKCTYSLPASCPRLYIPLPCTDWSADGGGARPEAKMGRFGVPQRKGGLAWVLLLSLLQC
jgi:hypothetical protein